MQLTSDFSLVEVARKNAVGGGVWFRALTSRGWSAYLLGILITTFYALLYWFPEFLTPLIRLADPISMGLRGRPSDQWFLYGFLYTLTVLIMGGIAIKKYRHNRYQVIRTGSVMFFQLGFAFLIPAILQRLNHPEFYFTYFWPLKAEYLFPSNLTGLMESGRLGVFMVFWSLVMIAVITPVLTYFFGKRWYCSWVCGCGGLAETAGDSFRHLSDKSDRSWRLEQVTVYSILGVVVLLTVVLWINYSSGGVWLGSFSSGFSRTYGFVIGSLFSGVIGTGFYPVFGPRIWCRFGCPMAAILGIQQVVFSRFQISVNGGQCISCGNCSVYCEMGIDVRDYARRGEAVKRASCVGCGMCAEVCPRGVLRLENSRKK